eukprot:TRINITY_DN32134_c0_g1_i1.p1 TRINITY_DN32134_c0_g1~~TRINITY_DN32134_c0_g1_i1.p1  ORF type:complete len:520 (-),score=78.63 TRINITY_DN32134_c0_g1_i1:357-1916(-)
MEGGITNPPPSSAINETFLEDQIANSSASANATDAVILPAYIAYTNFVLFSLVLAVGVIGNVLVLIVILTSKSMRSSTNLFLLNLSIADLLVLIVCCPNAMIEMYMRRDIWVMGKAMCLLVPFIELTVSHTSVLTILAITVERYYAVCLPLRAGLIWTKSKAGLVCLLSWLLSILLTSPILAIAKYKDDPHNPTCTTDVEPPWTKAFFLSIISLFFWLPLFVLVLLYAIIARSLTAGVTVTKHTGSTACDRTGQGQGSEPAAVTRGRRQIVVMLGTVVVFFFACLLPFKVLTMWVVISPYEIFDHINLEVYFNILYFCRLMFYINSAVNPILYNTMSSRFRERFRRVFGCGKSPVLFGRMRSATNSHTSSTRFSSSLSTKIDSQVTSWSDKSAAVPQSTPSQSQSTRKVSFHSSIGHTCQEEASKEGKFYDKNIQVSSNSKDFQHNGLLDNSIFLSSDPATSLPCDTDSCYSQQVARQPQPPPAPLTKYQQRSARNSLLKVASILSFSQFLETSKETYL